MGRETSELPFVGRQPNASSVLLAVCAVRVLHTCTQLHRKCPHHGATSQHTTASVDCGTLLLCRSVDTEPTVTGWGWGVLLIRSEVGLPGFSSFSGCSGCQCQATDTPRWQENHPGMSVGTPVSPGENSAGSKSSPQQRFFLLRSVWFLATESLCGCDTVR